MVKLPETDIHPLELFLCLIPVPAVKFSSSGISGNSESSNRQDAITSVGTTSVFPYITEPVLQTKRAGRPTVEINPGQTEISELVDFRLELGAAEALAALWRRVRPGR